MTLPDARVWIVNWIEEGLPLAIMLLWSTEHRAFAVETYFKNNEPPISVQRIFRRHFQLGCHDNVPDLRTNVE
ncbi:hypothetical protein ANN_19296 [Periplaneta americana]|uniref:DUF4817 domain-containing protein n=1 Tax=Periplaneta americana TaxID=6978 RepID=A0ABQ8S9P1_PERAM|nr:hypothetical protein ANN_19296 [Periplaneta americana]